MPMGPSREDVEGFFSFHPPEDSDVAELHGAVRDNCKSMGLWFMEYLPQSAERTHAINSLRETMFWANAAIACNPMYQDPIHPGEETAGADKPLPLQ